MYKIIACFFCLASFFIMPAHANEALPRGNYAELRQTGTAKVTSIIDPYTLQLEGGRIIRLSGLFYPDLTPYHAGPLSLTAVKVLHDLLEGKTVTIYQTKKDDYGRTTQMGHDLAHLERNDGHVWVQGTLISLGLARAETTKRTPEMAPQLYVQEDIARAEKLGLWEKDEHKILSPEETHNHINSSQVVEGAIESASIRGNRIYLNFGKNWRTDFTVSIAPEDKRVFSKAGIDPLDWNGHTIRARGWIRSFNGPYMEVDHPEAIQVLRKPGR